MLSGAKYNGEWSGGGGCKAFLRPLIDKESFLPSDF